MTMVPMMRGIMMFSFRFFMVFLIIVYDIMGVLLKSMVKSNRGKIEKYMEISSMGIEEFKIKKI